MPPRPRVARETRLLFATVLIAIAALWVLARIRFPDRPAPVNPVAPVLTQLAPTPSFGDLAAAVADVQPRALLPFVLVRLQPGAPREGGDTAPEAVAAFRVRDDIAVALLGERRAAGSIAATAVPTDAIVIRADAATGLAIVRVTPNARPALAYWSPTDLGAPRYLLATSATAEGLSLRPVFVSTLATAHSVVWDTELWNLPPGADLKPGTFVFSSSGAAAGLVVSHENRPAVLPMAAVVSAAEGLLNRPEGRPGWLGLEVQSLTADLAAATGAAAGVVVAWVDPAGPAAGSIQVADVLETVEGGPDALTEQRWRARTARLALGESLTIRVRRGTMTQPVRLTAIERPPPSSNLGLTLRRVRTGAEVLRVEPASAADRAGIRAGDILTLAGSVAAPSPTELTRAFAQATDRPLVVGVTRGETHLVIAVNAR